MECAACAVGEEDRGLGTGEGFAGFGAVEALDWGFGWVGDGVGVLDEGGSLGGVDGVGHWWSNVVI